MLRLRPYTPADAETVLVWCGDALSFYRWTAGVLGEYPITAEDLRFVEKLMPFVAVEGERTVGFFTLRRSPEAPETLRFGFVIVDPELRGRGYGKRMLRLGIDYAFRELGAGAVSLGVFENNESAYYCYLAAGFRDVTGEAAESYTVMGQKWKCRELALFP